MRYTALLCAVLTVFPTSVFSQHRKTISRAELEDILAHSVTAVAINDYCKTPDGHYPGTYTRIVHTEQMKPPAPNAHPVDRQLYADRISGKTFARYAEVMRLIRKLRPRMVADAVTMWGAWDWGEHIARCRATAADLKTIDPDLVVQGSVNEYVDYTTAQNMGDIPPWVWEAFDLPDEHRRFDIQRMKFADWARQDEPDVPQRWWTGDGLSDGLPRAVVPDIRTLEAKMWFYHIACNYMDLGCESLSFCQVELMNSNTHDPTHWAVLFEKLRAYADTKPALRFLLITGGTSGMRDKEGNLIFDFHTNPVRPSELGLNVGQNGGDCEINSRSCEWREGAGKLYTRSLGGRTPSGWECNALPGQIVFDNWDNSGPAENWGKPTGDICGIYNFDEITWFALQEKAYRDHWLRYAHRRVRQLDPALHLVLPLKRGIKPRAEWCPADYLASNPQPGFLDAPITIRNIPEGDVDRNAVQLYAGYGQEDVIQELLLASPAATGSTPELSISPNPAGAWINISLTQPGPASRAEYTLTSLVGTKAIEGNFSGVRQHIDVSALPRGLYILTVWDGTQRHAAVVVLD